MENIYQFSVKDIKGEMVSLKKYEGKVVLIVNTASKCGLTPQYELLQKLNETYKEKGLEILGFPCNQFLGQEPGSESDIASFCQTNFKVSFDMFSKIEVNGANADPLYKFLKAQKGGKDEINTNPSNPLFSLLKEKFADILLGDEIKWNFGKFLISRQGEVVARFAPTETSSISSHVEKLL